MSGEFYPQAKEKLARELKSGKFDRYAQVMKQAVHDKLLEFCGQDEEFAQAVAQGGAFEDCMKAVAKGVKDNGISDLDAYIAAVRFYFPGAGIQMQMRIDLLADVRGAEPEEEKSLVIDLGDFFV